MRFLLDLVVPPACLACGAPVGAELVCSGCVRALPWLRGWRCPRCGLPRHRRVGCPAAGAAFDRAWAPLAYEGVARNVVGALKFRRALPLAQLMGAQVAANLPADLVGLAVVPVPAQPLRRRARGFDPAGVLAAAVAARAEAPCVDVLRRRDWTRRQARAGPGGRRGARIHVRAIAQPPPRVLLVDDVHTTGTTLDVCAAALKSAGAEWVAAVSYARTL